MEFFRAGWELCKNVGFWQPCGAPSSDLSIRQESFCWQYYIDPDFEGTTHSAPPSCTYTEHRSPQQHRPGSSVYTPRACAKTTPATSWQLPSPTPALRRLEEEHWCLLQTWHQWDRRGVLPVRHKVSAFSLGVAWLLWTNHTFCRVVHCFQKSCFYNIYVAL